MNLMIRVFGRLLLVWGLLIAAGPVSAQHSAKKVLWFNAMPNLGRESTSGHREEMARYVDQYDNGAAFEVTYKHHLRGGSLAAELGSSPYDIIVMDMANLRVTLNAADKAALQQFYGSGRNSLMLDGSFAIRNLTHNPTTDFPGANGSSAGLLMNQLFSLAENGGGVLIGTDHDQWQPNANAALGALLPGARFQGTTNPSTDGDFIGTVLLAFRVSVKALDLLRHWESVPNQGEAPVGTFADFTGRPVARYSMVETADKPGGGRKRPYISASFFPGDDRIPIDSAEEVFDNIPTHKSGP